MTHLIDYFLSKNVLLESVSGQLKGTLIHYKLSDKKTHKPFTLVLKAQDRFLVVRNWTIIKELK